MTTDIYYTKAFDLLDEGNYEIAYATFVSVLELSIQQLHKVKFVHQTIVSTPIQYENTMTLIRSSIDQIEKITIQNKKLPGVTETPSPSTSPPPVPPKISPSPHASTTAFTRITSTIRKPTVPPKPRIPPPIIIDTTPITRVTNRHYKISPSNYTKNGTEQIECEEDKDDDDDDDIVIMLDNVKPAMVYRPITVIVSSENPTIADQSLVRPRSRSWLVQSDETGDAIDVLSETIVNPSNLVPAQTSDSSFHSYYTTDYVPNIPAPPLLATYRKLQTRKNELEKLLEESKKQQQQQQQQQQQILQQPIQNQYYLYHQQCQYDLLLSERSNNVASISDTLEKVRTLYMSAMTIPSILQFSPHLIAYQITLIESSIFRNIPCEALLSHSARTPNKKIVASTDFFNFITRSIEHSILLPQEVSYRAKIISRWIKIATKLLALNNYQSLKAVVSALGTPPVERLRRTWECIPKKHMSRLDLLSTLMSETNNYCRYREHMGLERKKKQQMQQHHVWTKPVVPFLGVFIHDVTYLQCAVKGNTNDTRFQDVLNHMDAFQRAPEYPQKPPPHYYANYSKNSNGNSNNTGGKKHIPNAITNALHLGSSTKNQNTNRVNTAALMGDDEEIEMELEQQLIMQYLLIRPWVSEKTIDALSNLRELSKQRSTTSPTNNRLLSNHNNNNNNNSIISKSTSLIRFNGTQVESNQLLEPEPLQVSPLTPSNCNGNSNDENKRLLGFWPFRKSNDLNRNSINTPPEPSWSEEEDEDEDEEEEEEDREVDDGEADTVMTFIDDKKGYYQQMIESQPLQFETIHDTNSTISLQIG